MRTGRVSSIQNGMATVVYGNGSASGKMPVLALGTLPEVGDMVVVAPLNGRADGIVLGRYWNENNIPEMG